MVGLDRFELSTPRLSSVCSDQLSYRPPEAPARGIVVQKIVPVPSKLNRDADVNSFVDLGMGSLRPAPLEPGTLRKEVIQPQVLLQLPC